MALSPMMKFYFTLKEKYNDSILFFRLGDFYEMFFEDAKIASQILDLTLTGRDCGLDERAPMCGIPYHAADSYIQKLVKNGMKVAICEQLGDASKTKGLVERDVVRVITPGTLIEDNILDEKRNNYIACITGNEKQFSVCWLDISTGEFNVIIKDFIDYANIEDCILSFYPSEVLCDNFIYNISKKMSDTKLNKLPMFQNYYEWAFDYDNAKKIILKQFEILSLEKFEFQDKKLAICSCGALLNYINETQKKLLTHINNINFISQQTYMMLDMNSRKNLELYENSKDGGKKASLLWVLDKTRTNMGARYLRRWLEQPLRDSKIINLRLDSVEELANNAKLRNNLYETLSSVKDIERITSKLAFGSPTPRELISLKYSLQTLPTIKNILNNCNSKLIIELNNGITILQDVCDLLENALNEDSPTFLKDGGYIKDSYNIDLDEYRCSKSMGKQWLLEIEAREKQNSGIKNLKIGYNKIFGYYIELSKSQTQKAPMHFIRKQTLTTGERYITEELKNIEEKLLGAVEKSIRLESLIFEEIKTFLAKFIPQFQNISKCIAYCDALLSLANVAVANNFCKPIINDTIEHINIIDGRHPVVEALNKTSSFVPNDTYLNCCQDRTMIITGPNMAGKSTYMRQVALITIMAHIGSFVPCKSAEISITDRIFTRIGASDDLSYGQSTFMVEMVEVATILQNATLKSLLILDEIGRGTSTFDGLSIARAVMEEVSQKIRCKTLFSTHYHELTELEGLLEGIKNYKILATEKKNEIIFLHKIVRGGTSKSFGIEVAKLAGLPPKVISRAREILKMLQLSPLSMLKQKDELPLLVQLSNQEQKLHPFKDALKKIDIQNLTPIQAFISLNELVAWAKEED